MEQLDIGEKELNVMNDKAIVQSSTELKDDDMEEVRINMHVIFSHLYTKWIFCYSDQSPN